MSQGIRLLRPDRSQPRRDTVDLDSQLPPDQRARLAWAVVEGLDFGAWHARIEARDAQAGRPAPDPAVLMAPWLPGVTTEIAKPSIAPRQPSHQPTNIKPRDKP